MKNSVEQKAIEIVMDYERKQGRNPVIVSKRGVGRDILSSGRKIEVKGVSESWKTHKWQTLHPSEVECMTNNPSDFFLYIVKFDDDVPSLYVIPGAEIRKEFKCKVTAYSLTPISQRKLKRFLQKQGGVNDLEP